MIVKGNLNNPSKITEIIYGKTGEVVRLAGGDWLIKSFEVVDGGEYKADLSLVSVSSKVRDRVKSFKASVNE